MNKYTKIFISVLLLFLLSGCFKTELSLKIDAKQNIDVAGHFVIDQEILTLHDLTLDDMINDSPFKEAPFLANSVDLEKEIDGKIYVGKSFEHQLYKESDLIKTEIVDDELHFVINPSTIESVQFNINALEDRKDNSQFLKELGVEAKMVIHMPAKIIWTSLGEINGNKVTIDLTSYNGEGIMIKSELHNNLPYYVIGGAVFIVSFAIVYLNLKKKKK